VVVKVLMIAGVVILPLPALVLGVRGVMSRRRRIASEPGERVSQVLLVALRVFVLLLVLALSAVSLLSLIGALVVKDAGSMPSLVYVFFFLDLLLGALVVLTFGRLDRRPARRPASPAAR
jgi:protein-S-isoprenylcysteine O-methyltransferase Ste14